jgi:hypothetical protein
LGAVNARADRSQAKSFFGLLGTRHVPPAMSVAAKDTLTRWTVAVCAKPPRREQARGSTRGRPPSSRSMPGVLVHSPVLAMLFQGTSLPSFSGFIVLWAGTWPSPHRVGHYWLARGGWRVPAAFTKVLLPTFIHRYRQSSLDQGNDGWSLLGRRFLTRPTPVFQLIAS